MRASNYTPVDAVKKLHEELDKLFAGKTFSGQGKNKPLNIFDFEFPTDFGNDEDVDTVAAAAPFILVKAAGWSIDKMEEPEMVDMSLIICTYQTPIYCGTVCKGYAKRRPGSIEKFVYRYRHSAERQASGLSENSARSVGH